MVLLAVALLAVELLALVVVSNSVFLSFVFAFLVALAIRLKSSGCDTLLLDLVDVELDVELYADTDPSVSLSLLFDVGLLDDAASLLVFFALELERLCFVLISDFFPSAVPMELASKSLFPRFVVLLLACPTSDREDTALRAGEPRAVANSGDISR